MVIPDDYKHCAMLWQAQTQMYFKMAGGYISGRLPETYRRWPILDQLQFDAPVAEEADQFKEFLAANRVSVVIVSEQFDSPWKMKLLSGLGVKGVRVESCSIA